jgi:hypothetical protein
MVTQNLSLSLEIKPKNWFIISNGKFYTSEGTIFETIKFQAERIKAGY